MSLDFSGAVALHDDREDALVVDDPDVPPFPTQQELAEEVVPHIIILAKVDKNGVLSPAKTERHKLKPSRKAASCGCEYHVGLDYLAPETLEGDLCRVCFTPSEIADAEASVARERKATDEREPINIREWLDVPGPARPNPKRKK